MLPAHSDPSILLKFVLTPEAMMQTAEQPIGKSNGFIEINRRTDWPPRFLRLVLGAVFAAGLGFVVLKAMYPVFVLPVDVATVPEQAPIEVYQKYDQAKHELDGKNYSVVFAIIGAVLGASCTVCAFGFKSIRALLVATVCSAILGGIGAQLSNEMFNFMRANSGRNISLMGVSFDGMKQSIVGYSLLWGLIGLGVGLGIGSHHGFRKTIVAGISGLLGGVVGAMIFVILTAQVSISTTMNQTLPIHGQTQVVWMVLMGIAIAGCIAMGTGEKKEKGATKSVEK
jgi:hypothetical protein